MEDSDSEMSTASVMSCLPDGSDRDYGKAGLSDIILLLDGKEFKLHRVVICEQSPKLKALCDGKDKVKLKPLRNLDYPQQSYEAMFCFMYGHGYYVETSCCDNPLGFHHDMYRLACYYGVSLLRDTALERFKNYAVYPDWYYFKRILRKGGYRNDPELYTSLVQKCHQAFDVLASRGDFLDLLKKDPELGMDLAQCSANSLRKFHCVMCESVWSLDITLLDSPSYCPNCGHYRENWYEYQI